MTTRAPNDEGQELMLRIQKGDSRAFEELVDLYKDMVVATAYRYLGDRGRAEDLAQEVFIRIYRARKTYRPLARFKTWCYRIIYNLAVNEAVRQKRTHAVSLQALRRNERSGDAIEDGAAADPGEALEKAELVAKVREAVLTLPDKQRICLVLNKYEGQSYAEIAEAMHMSIEAVKSMLFRAREKVRLKLARYLKIEASDEV